jgi:hypothetical protein
VPKPNGRKPEIPYLGINGEKENKFITYNLGGKE